VPTSQTLLAFALASALITVVPGPTNLFLLSYGLGRGRRAALAAVTGVELAVVVRVALTATGLSAALASSGMVFTVIRWAGVAYLLYLGLRAVVQALRSHRTDSFVGTPPYRADDTGEAGRMTDTPGRLLASVGTGMAIGLANPKVLIFYVAFFPQFLQPERGSQTTQILVLGAVYLVIGAIWDVLFAYCTGTIGAWLARHPRTRRGQPHVEAVAYLGMAAVAALTGSRSQQ
jgi:threonine/homoserine/homoserine lactone efflux protein